jgi:uncharacterized protein
VSEFLAKPATAFAGERRIAAGSLVDVALAVRGVVAREPAAAILVFDDATGAVVDLDLRGAEADIVARLAARAGAAPAGTGGDAVKEVEEAPRGRGRPKLGVMAREVTLLPRHWDWLAAQPGGASQALRRLVDQARRADDGAGRRRAAREAAYRFMAAMAGDRQGFEEASRALFAGDGARLAQEMAVWPSDIRAHVLKLVDPEATGSS